mmetsp:Transcript_34166/g.53420  ORF Transcript_34166/g.53420 Transcript_34166/m.53420 type:complete len:228 (-) Transcript_34166:70-753(-)
MIGVLLTIDALESVSHIKELYQQALLREVMRDTHKYLKDRVILDLPLRNITIHQPSDYDRAVIHRVFELRFDGKNLQEIRCVFWGKNCGNFLVGYLPPSTTGIQVSTSGQKYQLITRALPKYAVQVDFSYNYLFGGIDLQTLPLKLVELNLQQNSLSGSLSFFHLPSRIQVINLSENRILESGQNIYVGEIPESLRRVNLRETPIRHVLPSSEEFVTNTRVFTTSVQ